MAEKLEFLLPDIGDFDEVDVVEVLSSTINAWFSAR